MGTFQNLKFFVFLMMWKYSFSKSSSSYLPIAQSTEYKASYESYEGPPHPFHFGYDVVDEHGNKQQRQEQGDQHGTVKGSYSYTDAHGIYRHVDYVADHSGFRASVQSNEPGLGHEDPADVKMSVKPPPHHILEQQYSDPKLYLKGSSRPVYREASSPYAASSLVPVLVAPYGTPHRYESGTNHLYNF
ncbi:cuticle protein 7-like [Uloborus diversus]|uniref:cuticle protein 7-like n=1 Tax=Uloborus diversus TaxID=327109 RepID=UPI00240A2258|nr:cuticle protein 7-like [Uloborus diversus]